MVNILKELKRLYMDFGTKRQKLEQQNKKENKIAVISLTQDELNIILQLIKNSNFNGDMIETLYHLTTKLQKQYKK